MSLLKHNAERTAEIGLADAADGQSVVLNGTALDIIETVDEVDDGGLAGSRTSHEGNLLSGLSVERDVEEHLLGSLLLAAGGWRIAEVDIEEVHLAALPGEFSAAVFPCPEIGLPRSLHQLSGYHLGVDQLDIGVHVIGLGFCIEQIEHTVGTGHGVDDAVDLVGNLADRAREVLDERKETDERSDGK